MKTFILPSFCLKVSQNEFVSFWELTPTTSELYGDGFTYKGKDYWNELIPCYYNLNDKTISFGIVKDYYPDKLAFVKDEEIYFEEEHSIYSETKIIDIEFNTFEVEIINVAKCDKSTLHWYFTKEEQENMKLNDIFEIRKWKPVYVLENGKKLNMIFT